MGFTMEQMVERVRRLAGEVPSPSDGSPIDSMSDAVIQKKIEEFIQGEFSRFYPKFTLAHVTADGSRSYVLPSTVRDVIHVYGGSTFNTSFGNVTDVLMKLTSPGALNITLPSHWIITWKEVQQLRRVSKEQHFFFDPDTYTLHLMYAPSNQDVYYLAQVLREVDDTSLQALPADLDEVIEKGSTVKVLDIRISMLSGLAAPARSGGSTDWGAGQTYATIREEMEAWVRDELLCLAMRYRKYPVSRGL